MKKGITYGLISFALVFAILFAMSSVSALTLVAPASSGTVSGDNYLLNATSGTLTNITNCTFFAKSASTANISWVQLGQAFNVTGNLDSISVLFNSSALEDGDDYIFNATCSNETKIHSTINSNVKVDNTSPTAPSALSPSDDSKDTDGTIAFSGTVLDSSTTRCILYFVGNNPGEPSYNMTYATSSCTKSLTAMPEQSYQWYIVASDGATGTSSSVYTVEVDSKSSAGKTVSLAQQAGIESTGGATLSVSSTTMGVTNSTWGWIIGILVVLGIIGYFAFRK